MTRGAIISLIAALSVGALQAGAVDGTLPSGQMVERVEALIEDQSGETVLILRYLAPAIDRTTGSVGAEAATTDLDHLCAAEGLALAGPKIDRIVVSMMSNFVPRGDTNPNVTQFFGLYSLSDNTCIWEAF